MKSNSVRSQAFLHLVNNFQAQKVQRLRLLSRSTIAIGIHHSNSSDFEQERSRYKRICSSIQQQCVQ
ncbi:hypothetical protein [Chroococcidiopsis sp.]|uniref:hypothetical protein n=1 Tax=Chroococcidiopsis sp. TaxID=3088168 RepID=UPI003F368C2F